jgi:hypothetical protein
MSEQQQQHSAHTLSTASPLAVSLFDTTRCCASLAHSSGIVGSAGGVWLLNIETHSHSARMHCAFHAYANATATASLLPASTFTSDIAFDTDGNASNKSVRAVVLGAACLYCNMFTLYVAMCDRSHTAPSDTAVCWWLAVKCQWLL